MLIGKDRLGWMYTATAAHAAEEYAGKLPRTTSAEKGPISERDEAVNNTLWGIFNLAMYGWLPRVSAASDASAMLIPCCQKDDGLREYEGHIIQASETAVAGRRSPQS